MIKSINTIKMLGVGAVNKANSGHPGIVLGAAPMAYALFTNHLTVNPHADKWINRDRFILSAGHGSALLYSMLHLSGFNISIDDLKHFRQLGSVTPGHPESHLTCGVDVTTGPLGQGLAMAVGQALAETHLAAKYNKPNFPLFDHYTYVICGDGDLQEGVAQEAISLAGHWKLNKLIVLFDSNDVQLDNMVSVAQSENMEMKFKAANWNYIRVEQGADADKINAAIAAAKKSTDKPTLIEVKTVIGAGATKEGTPSVHGSPLGKDIEVLKTHLGWTGDEFTVSADVYADFKSKVADRGIKAFDKWTALLNDYKAQFPTEAKTLERALNKDFTINPKDFADLKPSKAQATRVSSGSIINRINEVLPSFIGGSADLTGSTKAAGGDGVYQFNHREGRNIAYGVREFAMTAINNGIYLHGGLMPFAGGFFVFADYMKPAMRLSALMETPVLFVLSHDSIAVGEDGPTHQPIEQIAMLRATPNLNVYRPADFNETLGAYTQALKEQHTPSAILITRQDLVELDHSSVEKVAYGAYQVYGAEHADVIITATGSEVSMAIEVAKQLEGQHKAVKVISMPSMDRFELQSETYRASLYNNQKALCVTLELGSTFGWAKYGSLNIGIDRFGISAPFADALKALNFTVDHVVAEIVKKLK